MLRDREFLRGTVVQFLPFVLLHAIFTDADLLLILMAAPLLSVFTYLLAIGWFPLIKFRKPRLVWYLLFTLYTLLFLLSEIVKSR